LLGHGSVDDVPGAATPLAAAQEARRALQGDAGTRHKVGDMIHTSMGCYLEHAEGHVIRTGMTGSYQAFLYTFLAIKCINTEESDYRILASPEKYNP
jgi:hypothetical protein